MNFLISNWKYVTIGILLVTSALFFKLWQHEVDEFNLFKAKVEVLGQEAERKAKEIEAKQKQVLEEVKHEFESKLPQVRQEAVDAYKRRYSGNGVRLNAGSGQVSRTPGSPQGTNGTSEKPLVGGTCDELFISDSAEDAYRVMLWIDWARKNNLPVR